MAMHDAGEHRGLTFRGTPIGGEELGWLQDLIDQAPLGYAEFARRACAQFGWVRPNGKAPEASCASFLRRLASRGLLRVPARERPCRRSVDRDHGEMLKALGTIPGSVDCQPSGPLLVRRIAREEWDGFRLHMDRYHYLGFSKSFGESLCYAAFLGNELVALLVWGAAVLHNLPRDRLIGWDAETKAQRLLFVVNNRRFLILPWIRQPHLASRVLSACLRRLSRDWQEVYGHPVWLAETFVDLSRFKGTCYRASNWKCLGNTLGFSRTRQGFVSTGHPKASFVYPLHRRAVEKLGCSHSEASLRGRPSHHPDPPCPPPQTFRNSLENSKTSNSATSDSTAD